MSKGFYKRIAKDNIKKNAKSYIPYILASVGTIAVFYIMFALGMNTNLKKLPGFEMVLLLMQFGNVIIGVFVAIFLFYTNSFLMKRRKKEFGLFNILGMEKRHIAKVLFLETIYVSAFSIAGGLLAGIILYKMMFLVLLRILNFEVVLGFEICVPGIFVTLMFFSMIYIIILFHNFRKIHLANPIELLHGSQVGEKEPKTKWIMALLGFICLGAGYYIANTVKTSMEAISLFFVAVLLVIIGTYCLFIAGSILVLKILRRNKKFYYHPKHFVSVSGMIYRMKQNAGGLANICVLSTMVLVMVSTTVSLYVGLDDALKSRYEKGVNTVVQELDYEDVPVFLEKAEKELDDDIRPEITTKIKNFEQYDEVVIGYPIWWGMATRAVCTFVEDYNWQGKTLIPYCTSNSSGLGDSASELGRLCEGANRTKAFSAYEDDILSSGLKKKIDKWLKNIGA